MFTTISHRVNTLLLVLLVLMAGAIIAILATRASGGPLDPPGPPASTMHTLDDSPVVWDRKLDSTNGAAGGVVGQTPAGCDSDRFKCIWTYQQCASFCITVWPAVLDRETGLVWQREPNTATATWSSANESCGEVNTGGREGWRLPTLAEFRSLRDATVATDPQLPSGNPFAMTLTSSIWWTSTEDLDAPTSASVAGMIPGAIDGLWSKISSSPNYWCVRGPTSNR
jgi:hypothetical protein